MKGKEMEMTHVNMPEEVLIEDEILSREGLVHLIGHVRYEKLDGELRVYPTSKYGAEWIGTEQYLGLKVNA